ncbi:MAG: hypothetical protein WC933_00080 [Candidatus Paceibacterota bacterium]|jgi:hypothetical protein
MEKIINTTKYMKAIKFVLIAVAFAITSPVMVLADEYTYTDTYVNGENNTTDTYVNGETYTYTDTYIDGENYTYVDTYVDGENYTYADTYVEGDYAQSTYYPTTMSQVYSGGYSLGTSYRTPSTYYSYGQPSTVVSGGFSAPPSYYVQPPTYYVQPSTVTSGSFNGASPTYYTQPVTQYVPNQVLAYTDTNPSLDSVYLSDIPATGFEDTLPMIIFISSLVLWSAILAYVFLKRKIEAQTIFASAYVNKAEAKGTDNSVVSEFMNQIASDNSDISKVEEYARTNKILLSGDASAKIVKLSRLGQINASDYIRGIATGEWIAIGEAQIK